MPSLVKAPVFAINLVKAKIPFIVPRIVGSEERLLARCVNVVHSVDNL